MQTPHMSSLMSECPKHEVSFQPIPYLLDLDGELRCHFKICGKLMKSSLFLTKDFSTHKKTTDLVIVCSTSSNTSEQKSLQHDLYTRNFDLSFEELNNIPMFPSLIILRLSHSFCVFRVLFISFI